MEIYLSYPPNFKEFQVKTTWRLPLRFPGPWGGGRGAGEDNVEVLIFGIRDQAWEERRGVVKDQNVA